MANTSTALLIVISLLSVGTIIKVFQFDSHTKAIEKELDKAEKELKESRALTLAAQEELASLGEKVEKFRVQNELLLAKRDSLALAQKKDFAADWDELQKIKAQQKDNIDKIAHLRILDQQFE